MDRPTPPPEDDKLLERLRNLGPVLDDLTREATGDGPGADGTTAFRADRPRSGPQPDRYRPFAAAAAVLLLVAGAIGIVALVSDKAETVRTHQPTTTTTTESDAALEARVAERLDGMEQCGPLPTRDQIPVPWPNDWEMVGSPQCDTAYVMKLTATDPVPVYPEPEVTAPVAYWSAATGWLDATEYRDPSFDLERYRAAYQAERKARGD